MILFLAVVIAVVVAVIVDVDVVTPQLFSFCNNSHRTKFSDLHLPHSKMPVAWKFWKGLKYLQNIQLVLLSEIQDRKVFQKEVILKCPIDPIFIKYLFVYRTEIMSKIFQILTIEDNHLSNQEKSKLFY